jgi:hypothetical protein
LNPPQDLIDGMLRDGHIGVMSSLVCLGAAVAVKRGEPIENVKWQVPGVALSKADQAFMAGALRRAYDMFKTDPPDSLDFSIALYKAHLKAAGYAIEEGMSA